jgi:hypothetical protein
MPQLGDRQPLTCPDRDLMLIGRAPGTDGTFGRAEGSSALPRDPNDLNNWLPGQGPANSCGTTTLTYVLQYLLGKDAPDRAEIDAEMRRADIFSAPMLLAKYADRQDVTVRMYNHATLDLLFSLVDRNIPVMVLTDTTPLDLTDTANLHWVAVVSHHDDRVGIYNPHGFQEELDVASFASHWREARIFGMPAWRNLAIAIGRASDALPEGGRGDLSSAGANLAANGVADCVNAGVGLKRAAGRLYTFGGWGSAMVESGRLLLAVGQLAIGAVALVVGGLTSRNSG